MHQDPEQPVENSALQDDLMQRFAEAQRRVTEQMEESARKYSQHDPKDRLIVRLVGAVADIDREVMELRAAKAGWVLEMEELRQRLEEAEEKIATLVNKLGSNDLTAALNEHLTTPKKGSRKKK